MALIKLGEVTVGAAGAASVTFDQINQTGEDLYLFGKLRSSDTNTEVNVYFNNDPLITYGTYYFQAFRTAESSSNAALSKLAHAAESTLAAEHFASWHAIVPNYAGTTGQGIMSDYGSAQGVYSTIGNATQVAPFITDPMESITIYPVTGFAEGTKLSLYMTKD
jgi:hypothetical protein